MVNFLSYDAAGRRPDGGPLRAGAPGSTCTSAPGSIYAKPVWTSPITESTPVGPEPRAAYATAKWRAELALQQARAESGFPVTIVRPSHTYDDANPPLPGGWTVVDRIARGVEVPVHGDGTSLWTLTHAEDFAQGLVGLLGNPRAIGEVVNITGDDVLTWDQIYTRRRCGAGRRAAARARALRALPGGGARTGSGPARCSATSGTARSSTRARSAASSPRTRPRLTFARAAHRMVAWRAAHPATTGTDAETEAVLDRIVGAYHAGRASFAERAPQPVGASA